MKTTTDYAHQIAKHSTEKLLVLLDELPIACADFMLSIADTTTILTRLAYAYDLRIFFNYVTHELPYTSQTEPKDLTDAQIQCVTVSDLEHFQQYLTLYFHEQEHENTVYGKMRKMSTLRSFYNYMFMHNRFSANIMTLIPLPTLHEKPIIRLEVDEVARLLDCAESGQELSARQQAYHEHIRLRDVALLTLMLGTGIRVSECVGINLEDINFEENAFLVTRKGGDQVILYFSEEIADALQRYLAKRMEIEALPNHESAFFLSLQKRRITQRAVQLLVKKYAAVAAPLKRKISPHKLRSTFGTNLYHETGDIYLVADVLGHADVNTTRKHYAAMTEDRRRMAAGVVKLREDTPTKEKK